MLHASTGNNYKIENNELKLVRADANFKGTKSATLEGIRYYVTLYRQPGNAD